MKYIHYLLMALLLAAALSVAGCTETPEAFVPVATPEATQTPAETPTDWSLTPGPVGTMPAGKEVSASANKDPITNKITVQFDGGHGFNFLIRLDVTVYTSDGRILEDSIDRPLTMGKSIAFDGTRGSDRVKITAIYNTGEVVVISDRTYQREDAYAK
jgi:hypothetical protein